MADELQVEREIILEDDAAEVWSLVGSSDGWQQWLVDSAVLEVAEGAVGEVTDDGVTREVRVTEVDEQRSVRFQWWEREDPSSASEVTIEVRPLLGGGSRVRILERPLTGATMCASTARWEVRALLLALTRCTLARV